MKLKNSRPNNKIKIVFFGNERLATGITTRTTILNTLILSDYQVEAIITSHVDSTSRQKSSLEVASFAHKHNIPLILVDEKTSLINILADHHADLAILAAFGRIIPQTILDMFPLGIINIHPSLLPKLRGSTPIENTILRADNKTGISIMKLVLEMDAGPLYAQRELKLRGDETKQELSDTLSDMGAKLLVEVLPKIIEGKLRPKPQVGKPSYTKRITKADGKLDPQKSTKQLEREIRAFAGWPKSYTRQQNKQYTITKVKISKNKTTPGKLSIQNGKLYFGCKDGSLEIIEIQPENKQKMNAAAFINGYNKYFS